VIGNIILAHSGSFFMKFITPFGKTEDYLLTFLIFRLYLGKRFLKNRRGIFTAIGFQTESRDFIDFLSRKSGAR
jgi:hypothetical protein